MPALVGLGIGTVRTSSVRMRRDGAVEQHTIVGPRCYSRRLTEGVAPQMARGRLLLIHH